MSEKFLNEYISQFMFDIGEITPIHLQSIRVGLAAYYKRIKYVNIEADLNENVITAHVKFKWWALGRKKLQRKIKSLFELHLPRPYKMTDIKDNQPVIEQVSFTIHVGELLRNDRVKML